MRTSLLVASSLSIVCLTLSLDGPQPQRSGNGINQPPVCSAGGPYIVECQGDQTLIQLDSSASFDPEGAALSFRWFASPGSSLDDPFSPTPVLTVDTSSSCDQFVGVRLRLGDGRNVSLCRVFVQVVPGTKLLELDIKPGSCPNPVNTGAGGVVPVSLLGTRSFDVGDVVLSSVRLGRVDGLGSTIVPTSQVSLEDTGTPFADDGCGCHALTGDGITDLSLKFTKEQLVTAFLLESEPGMSFLPLQLTGELEDGRTFAAQDCIRVQ